MTYFTVAYLYDGRISGIPMRCPKSASKFFKDKKQLGIPCALFSREDDDVAVLIDSYRYNVLEDLSCVI
jgi:hypothetical protein